MASMTSLRLFLALVYHITHLVPPMFLLKYQMIRPKVRACLFMHVVFVGGVSVIVGVSWRC